MGALCWSEMSIAIAMTNFDREGLRRGIDEGQSCAVGCFYTAQQTKARVAACASSGPARLNQLAQRGLPRGCKSR